MSVKNVATELVASPKIAAGTAIGTAVTGVISDFMQWIPEDIGKLAVVVSMILSGVLINTHWKRGVLERRKMRLEIAALEAKADDRRRRFDDAEG